MLYNLYNLYTYIEVLIHWTHFLLIDHLGGTKLTIQTWGQDLLFSTKHPLAESSEGLAYPAADLKKKKKKKKKLYNAQSLYL